MKKIYFDYENFEVLAEDYIYMGPFYKSLLSKRNFSMQLFPKPNKTLWP